MVGNRQTLSGVIDAIVLSGWSTSFLKFVVKESSLFEMLTLGWLVFSSNTTFSCTQ